MDMDNGYGSGYGYGYGLNITMDKCMQYYSNKQFFEEIKYIASHYLTRLNLESIIFQIKLEAVKAINETSRRIKEQL